MPTPQAYRAVDGLLGAEADGGRLATLASDVGKPLAQPMLVDPRIDQLADAMGSA